MIIKTKIVPKGFTAITLFAIIFTKTKDDKIVINHEKIHRRQQIEMLIFPFFLWYFIEALIRGYSKVSFEKEAYAHENDIDYLKNRRAFAWVKYL